MLSKAIRPLTTGFAVHLISSTGQSRENRDGIFEFVLCHKEGLSTVESDRLASDQNRLTVNTRFEQSGIAQV